MLLSYLSSPLPSSLPLLSSLFCPKQRCWSSTEFLVNLSIKTILKVFPGAMMTRGYERWLLGSWWLVPTPYCRSQSWWHSIVNISKYQFMLRSKSLTGSQMIQYIMITTLKILLQVRGSPVFSGSWIMNWSILTEPQNAQASSLFYFTSFFTAQPHTS